jgi:cytochrome c-type biogenesis protein CcmE
MKPRNRRFVALAVGLATLAAATALVLNAFNSNLVFFFSPTQVMANEAPRERAFRVGGLVEQGSVVREPQGLTIRFMVTDTAKSIPVTYTGLLPDLFQEGKGVVAQASWAPTVCFAPSRCWPNTTRTTWHPKRPKPWTRRAMRKPCPGRRRW